MYNQFQNGKTHHIWKKVHFKQFVERGPIGDEPMRVQLPAEAIFSPLGY